MQMIIKCQKMTKLFSASSLVDRSNLEFTHAHVAVQNKHAYAAPERVRIWIAQIQIGVATEGPMQCFVGMFQVDCTQTSPIPPAFDSGFRHFEFQCSESNRHSLCCRREELDITRRSIGPMTWPVLYLTGENGGESRHAVRFFSGR